MDPSALKDLGTLPFATLTAGVLWQILGPTAKYLGGKGQELTQKSIENIERILKDAHGKLTAKQCESGEVPPRVLRSVINEGAFTEDGIAASYLGGVLASSKVDSQRDDRGVVINSMISRLSVYQIRLHYVTYTAMHYLLQGTDSHLGEEMSVHNKLFFGSTALMLAMGFSELELDDPGFDVYSAMTHALYGLSKEELIADWNLRWGEDLICCPTPIGVELFLWANGQGRRNLEYFFDRNFVPSECGADNIPLVFGRDATVQLDNGEQTKIDGIDYFYPQPYDCPIASIIDG